MGQRDERSAGDLAAALTELQVLLLESAGVEDFLIELAGLAGRVVSPPAACGITVLRGSAR